MLFSEGAGVKMLKSIWYGVPYLVLLILGAITALAGAVTGWRWLERLELYLRNQVVQIEGRLC